MKSSGNKDVDLLYNINFKGNILHANWFNVIKTNGKPDSVAIFLLSEIVYWYRPKVIVDENDPSQVTLQKKFAGDILQLGYNQLNKKYGYTKNQLRRARRVLENYNLIKCDFRTVKTEHLNLGNVMFIDLNAEELLRISFPEGYPIELKFNSYEIKKQEVIHSDSPPVESEPKTNTKSTTERKNIDYLPIIKVSEAEVREQIDYDTLIIDRKYDRGLINDIVDVIVDVYQSTRDYFTIEGSPIPAERVKERFHRIDRETVNYVLNSLKESTKEVRNVKGYIITMLYNAPSTIETFYDLQARHDLGLA